MIFRGSFVLNRCVHSVYCVPDDWQAQIAWKIPVTRRVSWYCWICREYGDREFSLEKLHRLALANCEKFLTMGKIRKTDTTVLIKNADYDESDADMGEVELGEAELQLA